MKHVNGNVTWLLVYSFAQNEECTFIFQGPSATQLDLKVHSFSTEGQAKTVCKKPPVEVFSYSKMSKLRQLERVLCAEDDIVRMVTETSTAIITSTLRYGSFFVKVRPIPAPVTPQLVTQTKRYSQLNAERRSDHFSRRHAELLRHNADYSDLDSIDGMYPPDLQSIDFFSTMNQFEIPVKFRAQPQGFIPSPYYPGPSNPRPTDSYGAPVASGPILWGPYPGRPGPDISITTTSTQNPSSEWIGGTSPSGYPNSGALSTNSPVELTTTSTEPGKETEPPTSPEPGTTAMPDTTMIPSSTSSATTMDSSPTTPKPPPRSTSTAPSTKTTPKPPPASPSKASSTRTLHKPPPTSTQPETTEETTTNTQMFLTNATMMPEK